MFRVRSNLLWWITTISVVCLLVSIFCGPLFYEIDRLGIRDWDWVLFTHGSYIKSALEYRQLPLWNPWSCGGAALFQHPQVPMLTIAYLLEPFVGLLFAMKLTIVAHYGLALFGMILVARKVYGLTNLFSIILASAIFVFNSLLSLHIAEGHSWIFSAAYLPFIFLGFELYVAYKRLGFLVFGAACFALIVWSGGIYPAPLMAMFLCAYAILRAIIERDKEPIYALLMFGGYAFLFSAPKLIPVADYMLEYPRVVMDREYIPPAAWFDMFLNREQSLYFEWKEWDGSKPEDPRMHWGWVEYGCYVGLPLTLLFLISVFQARLQVEQKIVQVHHLSLLICWVGFFILFVGDFAYVNPYRILKQLPIFNSLHVTGRFLIILTFISSLFLMRFLHQLQISLKDKRLFKYAVALSCILIVGDMMWVSRNPLREAFTIAPVVFESVTEAVVLQEGPYQVVESLPSYGSFSNMYAAFASGLAIQHGLTVQEKDGNWSSRPQCMDGIGDKLRGFELHKPIIYSQDPGVTISNIRFTPNEITFDIETEKGGQIFLNQNYVRGWNFSEKDSSVGIINHKLAVLVSAGINKDVRFYYRPTSVLLGFITFAIGIIILFIHLFLRARATHSGISSCSVYTTR